MLAFSLLPGRLLACSGKQSSVSVWFPVCRGLQWTGGLEAGCVQAELCLCGSSLWLGMDLQGRPGPCNLHRGGPLGQEVILQWGVVLYHSCTFLTVAEGLAPMPDFCPFLPLGSSSQLAGVLPEVFSVTLTRPICSPWAPTSPGQQGSPRCAHVCPCTAPGPGHQEA